MFVPHRSLFEKGSIFDIGGFGLGVEWKEDVCMDGFTLWSVGYTLYNIQPSLGSFRGHPPCVHLYHPDRISGGVIPKKYPLHSGLNPALQSYFCYLLLLSFSSKPFMCSIWSTLIHSTHLLSGT